MVRRRISEAQRWQIIGMHTTGMSFKAIGRQMGAKHHAKRDLRCRSANSGRLMTLLDFSPADFRRFLTVLVDRIQPIPQGTSSQLPYGEGSVMVWGCISHDCKLDLVTIQGNLTGDQYIKDGLQSVVVPHFDCNAASN
jgi:hypothetical protein